MDNIYIALRFYKSGKKPTVMKRNFTKKKARDFCKKYKSTKNSFVGFTAIH